MMHHVTTRLSVSLPDDLAVQLARLAASSHVSMAATIRAILADVVPRMSSVLDYLGTAPSVQATDVNEANAWLKELHALYDRAPATFREAVGDFQLLPPPSSERHD